MESYISNLLIVIPALPLLAAVVVAALESGSYAGRATGRWHSPWPAPARQRVRFSPFSRRKRSSARAFREAPDLGGGGGGKERGAGSRRAVLSIQVLGTQDSKGDTLGCTDCNSRLPHGHRFPRRFFTAVMLGMVTMSSAWLVVIYASGYMHGDRGYWRFFAYVALFVFSMTMLVSVSNFVLLYVFWEAVGLCSYLLIGFWFQKPAAAAAGMKAFLVNRVGDSVSPWAYSCCGRPSAR